MTGTELEPTPSVNEWTAMQAQAAVLANSGLVPSQYRRKPDDVLAAALMGRELGWGVTTAMRFVHVIDGRPTVSPEGMLALVRRAGHSVSGSTSVEGASVTGKRADTGDEMTFVFTLDDARRAGLDKKQNWRNYPSSMCWARAVSQLCRMLFPDVLLGASYVPEEMGAEVGENGEPIATTAVEGRTVADAKRELLAAVEARIAEVGASDDPKQMASMIWRNYEPEAPVRDEAMAELLEDVASSVVPDGDVIDAEIVPCDGAEAPGPDGREESEPSASIGHGEGGGPGAAVGDGPPPEPEFDVDGDGNGPTPRDLGIAWGRALAWIKGKGSTDKRNAVRHAVNLYVTGDPERWHTADLTSDERAQVLGMVEDLHGPAVLDPDSLDTPIIVWREGDSSTAMPVPLVEQPSLPCDGADQ